jgi:hypothetical protein
MANLIFAFSNFQPSDLKETTEIFNEFNKQNTKNTLNLNNRFTYLNTMYEKFNAFTYLTQKKNYIIKKIKKHGFNFNKNILYNLKYKKIKKHKRVKLTTIILKKKTLLKKIALKYLKKQKNQFKSIKKKKSDYHKIKKKN